MLRAQVAIVGAGQLGSRHLQALQAVRRPLGIHVVDPSPAALEIARQRFRAVPGSAPHVARFCPAIEPAGTIDVAIVATGADRRREAVEQLLATVPVRYLVLEKLLYQHPDDRLALEQLAGPGTRAWVNCPMRMMRPYEDIRAELGPGRLDYRVSGSQFGLVTNAIHYLDHVAHLSGCADFSLDTREVDDRPVESKRPGFLELTGRLVARFSEGSRCDVMCHAEGDAPVVVEIFTSRRRYVVREGEGRLWAARSETGWRWEERDARIPYQSEMTAEVVESLLDRGTCSLTPLADSLRMHASLLEPLLELLRRRQPEIDRCPFT